MPSVIGLVFCLLAALSLKDLVNEVVRVVTTVDSDYRWSNFLLEGGSATGLSFLIWLTGAIVLCVPCPRIAAWLTPTPGARCLKCGPRLDAANKGICPECGAR